MKRALIYGVGMLIVLAMVFPAAAYAQDPPIVNPRLIPPVKGTGKQYARPADFHFVKKRPGHYTVRDWRQWIDTAWGEGLPTSQKLSIFDAYWSTADQRYGGFPNLSVNWALLRDTYRPEIAAGVSRGRFYAIMSRLWTGLQEIHTWVRDKGIDSSFYWQDGLYWVFTGIPLMSVLNYGITTSGLGLAMSEDHSLFVYRAQGGHPLGIQAGDIILGYDRRTWQQLLHELDSAQVPVSAFFSAWSSNSDGYTYCLNTSAGSNWMLFDTIDVVRYATGDTVHLSTQPFAEAEPFWDSLFCTDQIPVPGVPMPNLMKDTRCTWGIVQGTSIGYIYAYDWGAGMDTLFAAAVKNLKNITTGLILDFRFNLGGTPSYADGGMAYLFNENNVAGKYEIAHRSALSNHMGFTHYSPVPWQGGAFVATPDIYEHPIAVLTGPACLSAGDYNAFRMRFHPMVRFFGMRSNTGYVDGAYSSGDLVNPGWEYRISQGSVFSLINNEGYLIHKGFDVDEEIWHTRVDAANGVDAVVKRAVEWIATLTHAHDAAVNRTYYRSQLDTVSITAALANPLSHSTSLSAIVTDDWGTVRDSLPMFNDGSHGDLIPGDSIWGCKVQAPPDEGFFGVSVRTEDYVAGTFRRIPNAARFTTAGPVEFVRDTTNTAPRWGATVSFLLDVSNKGSVATIPSVIVGIRSLDTAATIVLGRSSIGNIAPGQVRRSAVLKIKFSQWCNDVRDIPVELNFSSQGSEYWRDTMLVHVTPTGIVAEDRGLPATYRLDDNYPNPFNPVTVIGYSIAMTSDVRLVIYDLLGREVAELVNERRAPGMYQAEFNGSNLASGVYFYRLTAGDFVQTKKLILLK